MCELGFMILYKGRQQESVCYVDQGSPTACQDFKDSRTDVKMP